MSKESQRYSIAYQSAANAVCALEHGYQIVRTYSDAGISGLSLNRRTGLKALLADVLKGGAGFSSILVYDVSRWGRFPDPDESAHYEFICRSNGVPVQYCAEAFANDGSVFANLVKQMKRSMAAEYSRELGVKVSAVTHALAAQGFRMTGGNRAQPGAHRPKILGPGNDGGVGGALSPRGDDQREPDHRGPGNSVLPDLSTPFWQRCETL